MSTCWSPSRELDSGVSFPENLLDPLLGDYPDVPCLGGESGLVLGRFLPVDYPVLRFPGQTLSTPRGVTRPRNYDGIPVIAHNSGEEVYPFDSGPEGVVSPDCDLP